MLEKELEDAIQMELLRKLIYPPSGKVEESGLLIEMLDERLFKSTFYMLLVCMKVINRNYKQPLTTQALEWYLNHEKDIHKDTSKRMRLLFRELRTFRLPRALKGKGFSMLMAELKEHRRSELLIEAGRAIVDGVADPAELDKTVDKVCELSYTAKQFSEDAGPTRRKIIHEGAQERAEEYAHRHSVEYEPKADVFPLGFIDIDRALNGGARREKLIYFMGESSSGKSRTLLNIGFNMAREGIRAMYVTIEMGIDDIELLYDSRSALLEYTRMDGGELSNAELEKLFKSLAEIKRRQDEFYIVDIPTIVNVSVLSEELRLYDTRFGYRPDVILVDYANLMRPLEKTNEGIAFDQAKILEELHLFGRLERVAVITAGQMNPKTKKESYSYLIRGHCDAVIRIECDKDLEAMGIARYSFEKNRFGKKEQKIDLEIDWARSFVGNRVLSIGRSKVA